MKACSLLVLSVVFLVLFSSPGYGGKTLKIGLLKFSRSVFDEEEQRMGERFKTMEEVIRGRFQIAEYLADVEISYEEIEAPKNIIDNTMTDETLTKLEKYCGDYGLDGIIFGHFEQTSRMEIVFRFYFSEQLAKKRGIKNRINSFYVEINLRELSSAKVQQVTNDLMDRLDFVLNDKKKVVAKKMPRSKQPPPIQPTKPKTKPGKKRTAPTKVITPAIQKAPAPLTIKGVYDIITERGFYCQSNPIQAHHNVLINLIVTRSPHRNIYGIPIYVFDSKRRITAAPLGNDPGIIKTTSVHESNTSDAITRYWAIRKINRYSFRQAQTLIEELNRNEFRGHNNWRIPTIADLLSIIEPDLHRNFFPSQLGLEDFFFVDEKDRKINKLSLWTSTPLKVPVGENKENLTRCQEDVYFIIRNTRDRTSMDNNWIGFDISCEIYTHAIIPVCSEVQASSTGSTQTPPVTPSRVEPQPSSTPTLRPVYAAQLDFLDVSPKQVRGNRKKELELISDLMAEEINRQLTEIQKKVWKAQVIINKPGHTVPNTTDNIERIIEIAFDQFMPQENRIDKIVDRMMTPHELDIIITGQYTFNPERSEFIIRPIVILKSTVLTENFHFDRRKLVYVNATTHRVNLKRGAKEIIRNSVRQLLENIKQ